MQAMDTDKECKPYVHHQSCTHHGHGAKRSVTWASSECRRVFLKASGGKLLCSRHETSSPGWVCVKCASRACASRACASRAAGGAGGAWCVLCGALCMGGARFVVCCAWVVRVLWCVVHGWCVFC